MVSAGVRRSSGRTSRRSFWRRRTGKRRGRQRSAAAECREPAAAGCREPAAAVRREPAAAGSTDPGAGRAADSRRRAAGTGCWDRGCSDEGADRLS